MPYKSLPPVKKTGGKDFFFKAFGKSDTFLTFAPLKTTNHEEDFPAISKEKKKQTRIQTKNVDCKRTQGSCGPQSTWKKKIDCF